MEIPPLQNRSRFATAIAPLYFVLERVQRSIQKASGIFMTSSVNNELFRLPRNMDIFPSGLGGSATGSKSKSPPYHYYPRQLERMFALSCREEDHVDSIIVSWAAYCKQPKDAKHEFILLEVRDTKIPSLSNYLVLERTDAPKVTRWPSVSASSASFHAEDRLLVSSDGGTKSLLRYCNLSSHDKLEDLKFSPSKPFYLYELLILAMETSAMRERYSVVSAQCFWFASSIWECLRTLRSDATVQTMHRGIRGRFNTVFRQQVSPEEVNDILFKFNRHLVSFRIELSSKQHILPSAAGTKQQVEEITARIKELEKMIEHLAPK